MSTRWNGNTEIPTWVKILILVGVTLLFLYGLFYHGYGPIGG